MKTSNFKCILLLLLLSILNSCNSSDDEVYEVLHYPQKLQYSEMELDLLNLVTNYRLSKDLNVLSRLDKISSVAMSHSVHMVKEEKASHENFPERNKYLVNEEKALAVGENIAYGFGTVEGAFNSWINSEGHHKLLLKDTYTHFGISIEKGHNGILSITLMFIKK